MFKELLSLFKKGDLMHQALDDTLLMLNRAGDLFTESTKSFLENREPAIDVYKTDRKINAFEKEIRRKIFKHVSVNPQQDIEASLMLTTIIVSIERVGDYSKNISELTRLCGRGKKVFINPDLKKNASVLMEIFTRVAHAFETEDDREARTLMEELNTVKKQCESHICEAVEKKDASIREAIVNVLFARYLKRVAAHLESFVSGIANPFDMIGFYNGESTKEAD